LVDLQPYVEDPKWGYSLDEQADFYPVFWDQDVFDGRRLGIPALRSGQVLYYNTTWAKELGYPAAPVLPEQFQEQACAAASTKRKDADPQNDSTGGWIVSADYPLLLGWIYSFGGEIIKNPEPGLGETVYQFNTPQVEETFTFLKDLYDQGCAWLAESQYPEAEFAARMGLFSAGSVSDIPYQAEAYRQSGNRDEWTVIPFPSPSLLPGLDVYGPSYVMLPSGNKEQMASWLLIKWLSEPENQARMVEATGAFPLRASTLTYLDAYQSRYPQWAAALKMLPTARNEPAFQSWSTVRWSLSDAGTQLFRSYFTIDQVPRLIEFLEKTAADLHIGPELSGVYHTPTFTPTPSSTPTRTRHPSATPTFTRTPRPIP
jgi:ABC-type glycerol-3-phosphate transport system substrate-binding protein